MRLVFFGTSGFAVPCLDMLATSGHELVAAVCPSPSPQGRGRQLVPCPVETRARARGITVLSPPDPDDPGFLADLRTLEPGVGVLAAYGYILRPALLELPGHGFVNLHPSLLPKYRGAAPVLRCLLDGAAETGVSVIRMTRRVDAGPVLARQAVAIEPEENRGELEARLAELGAKLMTEVLDRLETGAVEPEHQDPAQATPAPKLKAEERQLDWTRPAAKLHDQVRALAPAPGAWTGLRGRRMLVLRTRRLPGRDSPGPGVLLLDRPGLVVGTEDGLLELVDVKPESGRLQSGRDLRNGLRLKPGEHLG